MDGRGAPANPRPPHLSVLDPYRIGLPRPGRRDAAQPQHTIPQTPMRLPVTLLVLLASSLPAWAAPDPGTPPPASLGCTRLEPMESHVQSIDLSALVDIRELYEALEALGAPKDEFETTAQYEDRLRRLRQETRVGGRALTDTFMVMAPINRYYFHYDADRQTV